MHAGDAIWYLHAGLKLLREKYPQAPKAAKIVKQLQECAHVIGDFCGVQAPGDDDTLKVIGVLESVELNGDSEQPTSRSEHGRRKYSDTELVEAGRIMTLEMVDSGCFDWADIVSSIDNQLKGGAPFLTPKQCRALLNVAKRGRYTNDYGEEQAWLDDFEDEHPEAIKLLKEHAALA